LLTSLVFAYIYISQVSVEMHLPCGGIYITLLQIFVQCASVKSILKICQ